MNPERYAISPQLERAMHVIRALFGHTVNGLSPKDLAAAAKATPSSITRTLAQMRQLGVVEQIQETGRWRLGPMLVQGAIAHSNDLERATGKLTEIKQRYSREPK